MTRRPMMAPVAVPRLAPDDARAIVDWLRARAEHRAAEAKWWVDEHRGHEEADRCRAQSLDLTNAAIAVERAAGIERR